MKRTFVKAADWIFVVSSAVAGHALATEPTVAASTYVVPSAESRLPVRLESITVRPEPAPSGGASDQRWVKFEQALGPGRSRASGHRVHGWRNNDGTRVECYSPCFLNCCAESGGFSLLGAGFGR